jgi:hypothetical protein
MKLAFTPIAMGLLFSLSTNPLRALDSTDPDKGQYHLFNPTPRALLREMTTDRPDKTESPFTVDAGQFQVEADILNYSYDRYNSTHRDTRVEAVSIAPVNLKLGLANNVDLQLILQTYNSVRTHDVLRGSMQKNRGFGDIQTRLKVNLFGNDGGAMALGVIPYLKLPSSQDELGNDALEGGVIVPFAAELACGWSVGLMTEFDCLKDAVGGGYHVGYVNSITFGHGLIGRLAGYVELFSALSAESGASWIGTFDLGLTYGLTDDIQLDAGVNLGITRSADDINPFIGISWRF